MVKAYPQFRSSYSFGWHLLKHGSDPVRVAISTTTYRDFQKMGETNYISEILV